MYSLLAVTLALALSFFHFAHAYPVYTTEVVDPNTAISGRATWFYVGLGACGYTDTDLDWIVALNEPQYTGSACNRFLVVENTQSGATAVAKVRDMCPGCAEGSLDMSPDLFKAISTEGLGEGTGCRRPTNPPGTRPEGSASAHDAR
ncbi:hypothetical protein DACRYDRAFT_24322 [Dacryopinax primogenitus]|uniref:Barwin domain-containing protein n=1 Tax=Dacryopinax primogenitus (strain DJM 731) TaxID=1858805 RepID=M5FSE1_DACPD|nr:uncharacterized protein DACRYDRAFT_24322 [Dacryopinax primogenitus]EJT98753.1 hypothetical protein DACRYDRAFT_24322 [Dacryopinax primogenitus]